METSVGENTHRSDYEEFKIWGRFVYEYCVEIGVVGINQKLENRVDGMSVYE